MRILIAHNFYQQFGGEDSVALSDKVLLESRGNEVFFYTRHNDEIRQYGLSQTIRMAVGAIASQRTMSEVTSAVKMFKPDVAYVHNVFPLMSPSLYRTLRSLGIPTAQVVHTFRPFCANGLFYTHGQVCERCGGGNYLNALLRKCHRNSYCSSAVYAASMGISRLSGAFDEIDAFICLTGFAKQKLLALGVPEKKLFVKPNCIDTSAITPSFEGGEYVLYLGRLSSEKGLWTLLHAFEELKDINLKIVGTGPLEASLRAHIEDRGMENVTLVGFTQGEDKWALLKNCMFTVVPSQTYENFPVAVLEAYAAGKPVIGSSLGSVPYVVEDGRSGLLFSAGCSADLASKIRFLCSRPDSVRKMGLYCRDLVQRVYDSHVCYSTLMDILSSICAPRDN